MGALRDLKKDLGSRRGAIVGAIVREVERRTYTTAIGQDSDSSEDEDQIPELSQTLVMDEVWFPCHLKGLLEFM